MHERLSFYPIHELPPNITPVVSPLVLACGRCSEHFKGKKRNYEDNEPNHIRILFFMGNPVFCVSHVDNRSLLMIKKREKKKANCELTVVCAIQQKLFVCRHLYSKRPNGVGRLCKKKYTNGLKFVNFVIL